MLKLIFTRKVKGLKFYKKFKMNKIFSEWRGEEMSINIFIIKRSRNQPINNNLTLKYL